MENYECFEVKGKPLEFIETTHTYLYDGIVLPSITQLLSCKFGSKYDGIPKAILQRASAMGSAVHKAIEDYEQQGIETDLPELRGWKSLKKAHGFDCLDNEVPVVLFKDGEAVAAGRLDLVLVEKDCIGLGDVKRTSKLDEQYLKYQLNCYRVAYTQCYGAEIGFLRGIHLREDVRKYIDIPINENLVSEVINDYLKE